MKNKGLLTRLITLAIILVIVVGAIVLIKHNSGTTHEGLKSITIKIEDRTGEETKVLLEATEYITQAEVLGDLLKENSDELKLNYQDSEYGMTIYGLLGLDTADFNVGPWWMYESDDSECCKVSGFCPAVNECTIVDGESYTFFYMSY